MKPIYIPCDCHTAYHFIRITEDEDRPDYLYAEFVSTRNGYFWHRVKWALKHVFGREDLTFADVIIKRQDLCRALNKNGEGCPTSI